MLIPTHGWFEKDGVHGDRRGTRSVRINLRGLFSENPNSGVIEAAGLDVNRIVSGLTSGWWDSLHGSHLVLVNYEIPFADPHIKPIHFTDQVVSSRWVRTVR